MSESQPPPQRPPPLPPQAIQYRSPGTPARANNTGLDDYQRVADTVGMVPSLRWKDNVIQAVCVGAGAVIGATAGFVISGEDAFGAVVGGVLGLVAALFISGIVLMILGLARARKR